MVNYDSKLRDELDWLLREYEKLKSVSPELQRDDILMLLCSKILAKQIQEKEDFDEYDRLSDSEKELYNLNKTQHPKWTHKQLMIKSAFD